jgi:hypothetical protein
LRGVGSFEGVGKRLTGEQAAGVIWQSGVCGALELMPEAKEKGVINGDGFSPVLKDWGQIW